MEKAELLNWLQDENRQFEAFLEQIGRGRMDQPGVNGRWSVKDVVAHMIGWQHRLIAYIQAARAGDPTPPPPWPATLEDEDEINAWIYETNRGRSVDEVLDEARRLFQQLLDVIEGLPDDVEIEEGRLVHLGGQRYPAGEFFDHFHDDHEPDMRAWLARIEQP